MLLSFVWRDAYVAPRVGAWIETLITAIIFAEESMSLPAWERGLKHSCPLAQVFAKLSLPAWERGLKP